MRRRDQIKNKIAQKNNNNSGSPYKDKIIIITKYK